MVMIGEHREIILEIEDIKFYKKKLKLEAQTISKKKYLNIFIDIGLPNNSKKKGKNI